MTWREMRGKLAAGAMALVVGLAVSPWVGVAGADIADFTDRDTGLYPDIQQNAVYQNSGNRGCAACHDNLFDVDKNNGTYVHITNYVGLKKASYLGDCQACHSIARGMTGNVMSENIHVAHYSSDAFVAANGNCWSCHAMAKDGDNPVQMYLFEEVQYDAIYGGYCDAQENPNTTKWGQDRNFGDSGFLSGVSATAEPQIDVVLDQMTNAEEDEFLILNYERIDGNDAYAELQAAIDDGSYRLEVTGVVNEASLSLDDLRAMPQREFTSVQWCAVNGINGAMADNMPMSGILLSDFIDAMGGLADGVNAVYMICADGWWPSLEGVSVQDLIDSDTYLVLGNYGHDLTVAQGAPVKMITPGTIGATNCKNLIGLQFVHLDEPVMLGSDVGLYPLSTTWFVNDGVQAKVGEPISIEGAAYGYCTSTVDLHPVKIDFSFDYGRNWTTYEVPADFDQKQWVHYTLTWTPEAAGTYILKAKTTAPDGTEQAYESSLIVVVSE